MELRTLRYFLAVAREENMTEAANVLHVTQPTLSRQIADLERELGCTLFERTNRATVLTESGMRLRQRAEEILGLVAQTQDEMAPGTRELSGNIRIGAGETYAMHTVTDAFAALHREHPGVTCELFTGNVDVVEERLERGLIDFALVIEPVDVQRYEWIRLPEESRLGMVVGANSPWAHLRVATPTDVAGMPLLVSSRTSQPTYDLERWSGGAIKREQLNVVGAFDLVGNASLLAQTGEACVLSIDRLLQLETSAVRFVPLEPEMTTGAYLIWKRYRMHTPACREFLARLRAACPGAPASVPSA